MRYAWVMRWQHLLVLSITLAAPLAGSRPAFYWTSTEGTLLALDYLDLSTSDFDSSATGAAGGQRSQLAGQYEFNPGRWVLAGGHEYNALDIDELSQARPASNGHLHTLHIANQWRSGLGKGSLRLALAPALSVSSNALKNLDELDSDAFQLWAAGIYTLRSGKVDWIIGAANDHRFGERRLYPVVGLAWQGSDSLLRLTYPDLMWRRPLGRGWSLQFTTSPDGNWWSAYDKSLEQQDDFRREAWHSELQLYYSFHKGIETGLSAGYHWDQQWKFRRRDGQVTRTDSEDSPYIGVNLRWRPAAAGW